ncbi:MAG: aldo/keto reductase [Chloroflexi bacterium]|nr:MAG: aldo/keto reductase [Chloroflexota bacterium]
MQQLTRRLGQSDLEITKVGIGTAPIGSATDWKIYWGPQDEDEALRAIETAIDLGVNWIDTAPFYGWGRAEQIVGKALRGKRDKAYIFTKCGTLRDEQGDWYESLKPESIRREVEASLRNLQTDYIDLYQFHDPDPHTPIEESWGALQALIQEGKVRYGGLSNHPVALMERVLALGPIASNQHQYNLLNREIERDVLSFSQAHNIGVLCWSPLASGFLVDTFDLEVLDPQDFRRKRPFAQEPTYTRLKQLRKTLQSFAHDHNRTLFELAIAWILRHPAVTGAIIGIRSALEAQQMLNGCDWSFTDEDIAVIDKALSDWEN